MLALSNIGLSETEKDNLFLKSIITKVYNGVMLSDTPKDKHIEVVGSAELPYSMQTVTLYTKVSSTFLKQVPLLYISITEDSIRLYDSAGMCRYGGRLGVSLMPLDDLIQDLIQEGVTIPF